MSFRYINFIKYIIVYVQQCVCVSNLIKYIGTTGLRNLTLEIQVRRVRVTDFYKQYPG